ncbi:unnamed protein product, partial [Ectocarpus sp. 13 AM-2016]
CSLFLVTTIFWVITPSTRAQDSQNGSSYFSTATPWIGARFFALWAQKPKLEITRNVFLVLRGENGATAK